MPNKITKKSLHSKNNKLPKKGKTVRKKKIIIVSSSSRENSNTNKEKIEKKTLNVDESKIDLKEQLEVIPMATARPSSRRLNETFIELMEKLSDIMLKQGEPFRARAYQKAQETIMTYPTDILSPSDLKNKPGIGSTIMDKLEEYVNTGTLRILEREKNNPANILGEIYGIGPKKAKELVDNGITSIQQLRENQHLLNDIQKIGLKYYEDILKRIPRSEIMEYEKIFEKNFPIKANTDSFEIVGSYRRGAESSGDIDVIITSKSPKTFVDFIDALIRQNIIAEVLSRGPTKCLVVAKIPQSDSYRRVDFLYTTPEEFPFAILYFTGSKIFNTVMRHQALSMGLTMNEHGLYKFEGKKKGEKVDHIFNDERDIFDYLNLEYKSPIERTDGRAIIVKSAPPIQTLVPKKKIIIEDESKSEEETFIVKPKKTTVKKRESLTKNVKKTKKNIVEDEVQNVLISNTEIDPIVVDVVNDFRKNGIRVLNNLNENQLSHILRETNKAYYNQTPIMTDNEYDIVKEYIEQKYPSNSAIHEIGAPVERNKVRLPYEMWSMDKIKPDTGALVSWTSKFTGPYVISCKLDGVSGLYTTEGATPKLYTRGDGKVGQDISHLISHLRLPKTKGIVIRGEFIIPKNVFDTKYKNEFANPRNMVAGLVNHKTINIAIKDVHFVAYEVIVPAMKPSDQMALLATLDVEVVLNQTVPVISNEFLSEVLVDWRKQYVYEIDGIIVTDDKLYERKSGNPEHAFAFKMVLSDQIAEAKVVDVIWAASKDGYLKPRVQIEPINLGGVTITYATGFNGAFINDNKIGVGAVIELIRSGDVIPYIRKVVVPAQEPKMPDVPYAWNDTHVDIMLEDLENDDTVREKNITGFFRGIGVEGLSSGNVTRIINAGYDSVPKIIKMELENFLEVEGFKTKMSEKIYNGIREKLDEASLVKIMAASNMFGRGFSEKKMELIMESYPTVLLSTESTAEKINNVASIKGMAHKSAEAFVERIPDFIRFMKEAGLVKKLSESLKGGPKLEADTTHPLYGKTIVMTGFRDANIQNMLKTVGAKLGASVSKNTFIVLVKDKDEDTGKAADARRLGVPLMTPQEFTNQFMS
jgi:DNA ligase (NAD+)